MDPELDRWRISGGWHDVSGNWNPVREDVREQLRRSIDASGGPYTAEGPPLWFVAQGSAPELNDPCAITLDTGEELDSTRQLPTDLPLGSHRLIPLDGGPTTHLFITPSSQILPDRSWGWTAQLYGLRSLSSWGHGDLSDLAQLTDWAGGHGAGLVSINPLGDVIPVHEQQTSPYFGSSRRFMSLLYLDVEAVPGSELLGEDLAAAARTGRSLSQHPWIERTTVFELKLAALRAIWRLVNDSRVTIESTTAAMADVDLVEHATFNALAAGFGSGWSSWPIQYRHPGGAAVEEFREANRDEISFWIWVQLLLEDQLRRANDGECKLMRDLAVGFDPDGSDAWQDQDHLGFDWRIGAPGDEFNPDGQNWGIVPYFPQSLRRQAYEPWLRTIRRVVRNCSALRIDHVMGLFRQFLIPANGEGEGVSGGTSAGTPAGMPAGTPSGTSAGAYIYQYGTELLDLALMEAMKAGVWLAGEDLGTVESGVRRELTRRQILGYRVGWFEESAASEWPRTSIGSVSTHDLPTIAGLLSGQDLAARRQIGLASDEAEDAKMLDRLMALADGSDEPGNLTVSDVIIRAHAGLSGAGSQVVCASLEDACEVTERPNIPGTTTENPNWQRFLPVALEELDSTLAPRIANVFNRSTR